MHESALPLGWLYLPVAFALGALHALEPGHGKSLASAYLVSGKHTRKDAVVLGLATTFAHTAVVVFLASAAFLIKGFLSEAALEHGVSAFGAVALVLLGAWVSFRSIRDLRHGHAHGHAHSHGHGAAEPGSSLWSVAVLGFSNGLLPCPGALAALIVALSLGQVALGLTTVLVYSLGLATALALMGVLVVEAGQRLRSWLPSEEAMLWLPLCSGLLVLGTGCWLFAAG